MTLPQITDSIMAPSPIAELSVNSYLVHTQDQPLTELMVDIIIFQWRERALYADIEIPDYRLN